MKKYLVLSVLSAALLPAAAFANDGFVEVKGRVNNGTCVVAGGSDDQIVTMPAVSAASMANAGALSLVTPFDISLTGCAVAQRVSVQLDGGIYGDANSGSLMNLDEDGAKNVQVGVVDRTNYEAISLPGSPVFVTTSAGGVATIPLGLRYVSLGGTTAGAVSTGMGFDIVYP